MNVRSSSQDRIPNCFVYRMDFISFRLFIPDNWVLPCLEFRPNTITTFQITERTKICSLHFKPTDFRKSLIGRRYLMDDAVPSIFLWSAASPKRKSPRKRSQHTSSAAKMPSFGSVSDGDDDSPASDEISDLRAHIAKLEAISFPEPSLPLSSGTGKRRPLGYCVSARHFIGQQQSMRSCTGS